jgi:hypothetical protein
MPRSKRWFPLSQEINTDPEVRKLKRDRGMTGLCVWLEILARTDGRRIWKGEERDIISILAGACETNTRGAAKSLQYLTDMKWIGWLSDLPPEHVPEGICVPSQRGPETAHRGGLRGGLRWGLFPINYQEFHKYEGREPVPSEPSEPSQPNPLGKGRPEGGQQNRGLTDKTPDSDVPLSKKPGNSESDLSELAQIAKVVQAGSIDEMRQSLAQAIGAMEQNRKLADNQAEQLRIARLRVSAAFGRLVKLDTARFDPLLSTISKAQRDGYDNNIIAAALDQIERNSRHITDPCGYLVAVLDRQRQNANAAAFEAEHAARKKEEMH